MFENGSFLRRRKRFKLPKLEKEAIESVINGLPLPQTQIVQKQPKSFSIDSIIHGRDKSPPPAPAPAPHIPFGTGSFFPRGELPPVGCFHHPPVCLPPDPPQPPPILPPGYMMHPAAAAFYAAALATAGLFLPPFGGNGHSKSFFDGPGVIRPHPLLPHHFGLAALPPSAPPPLDIEDLSPTTPMVDVVDSSSSCSSVTYQKEAFREQHQIN